MPESVDPPLIVTLVLDTVNVGFQHVSSARQEIARFLRENGGHLAQPVSIFLLTNDGLAAHFELSTDGNALAEQLDHLDARLRTMDRAQGNWGEIQRFAFSMQMSDKILNDQEAQSGRKLLIWVGYGWPMLNGPAFESSVDAQERHFEAIVQLSARLRESHVVLSSISLGEVDPQVLQELSETCGRGQESKSWKPRLEGARNTKRRINPRSEQDLASQIDQCIAGSGPYYVISFDPPRADHANEYHDLRVQIDRAGLTPKTTSGYYIQP